MLALPANVHYLTGTYETAGHLKFLITFLWKQPYLNTPVVAINPKIKGPLVITRRPSSLGQLGVTNRYSRNISRHNRDTKPLL